MTESLGIFIRLWLAEAAGTGGPVQIKCNVYRVISLMIDHSCTFKTYSSFCWVERAGEGGDLEYH